MSTRSLIAIKNEDNSYDYIYCHFDGYPSFTGLYLYDHYKTREKVRKLIDMGNRSCIDNDNSLYDEPFLTLPNLDRLVENFKSSWCEYLYFYDDNNKWYVHDGEEVTLLSTKLMLQGEPIDDEPIEEEEKFKPTAEALLFTTLQDWGLDVNWNYKIFHGIYEDFMKSMEKHGYAEYHEEGDE